MWLDHAFGQPAVPPWCECLHQLSRTEPAHKARSKRVRDSKHVGFVDFFPFFGAGGHCSRTHIHHQGQYYLFYLYYVIIGKGGFGGRSLDTPSSPGMFSFILFIYQMYFGRGAGDCSPDTHPSPGVFSSGQTVGRVLGSQLLRSHVFSSAPPAHWPPPSGPRQ